MDTTRIEAAQPGSKAIEPLTTAGLHGQRLESDSAMTDHVDSDDYALRALIELMQQKRSSEREIEAAVREASGCPSHPASSR
ncbi:MAG: hypothetical protein QOH08_2109, partial [Chloroflexota bacterium]|nr:hypothetical protein [Chloroflexota bacterium]